MKKMSKLKKILLGTILAGGIGIGTGYKLNKDFPGETLEDYIGGTNKVQIYEEGEEKEMKVKVYPLWKVKPNHCALYARLITESMGNEINRGNAWDLVKNNENYKYGEQELSPGDLVGLYHAESAYRKGKNGEEREYSHVATYLGKNKEGKEIYAEQRGKKSRITTLDQFQKYGWEPKRIIKVKKN